MEIQLLGKRWWPAMPFSSVTMHIKVKGAENILPNGLEVEFLNYENEDGERLTLRRQTIDKLLENEQ